MIKTTQLEKIVEAKDQEEAIKKARAGSVMNWWHNGIKYQCEPIMETKEDESKKK